MEHVEQEQISGGNCAGCHELICRIVRREMDAWEQLSQQLQKSVARILAGQFPGFCLQQIEDIVQDTLVTVWNKAATYHGFCDREAFSWVARIAKNRGIDIVRRGKRSEPLSVVLERKPPTPANWDLSDCDSEWTEFFASLTGQERRVVKGLMAGKKAGEIARELDVAPSRVSELKKQIRQKGWPIFHPNGEE